MTYTGAEDDMDYEAFTKAFDKETRVRSNSHSQGGGYQQQPQPSSGFDDDYGSNQHQQQGGYGATPQHEDFA